MTTHEVKTLTDEIADDPELRREVECEWFSDGTIIQIEQKMEALGLSRKELASRLKCSPANVTQLLRRGSNLTLETLMDIALAMDHRFLPPNLVPLSSIPPWETCSAQQVNCSVQVWGHSNEATTVALRAWVGIPASRETVVPYQISDDVPREAHVH